MLALKEFRAGKAQFGAIVTALSLIVFLVLVLAALADGLFYGATGAIKQSDATHYVFSEEAEGSFVRSRLKTTDVAAVAEVTGVDAAGPVGVLLTGGVGPNGPLDVAVFGIEPATAGIPVTLVEGRLPEPGEDGVAAVDLSLADEGAVIGTEVSVGDASAEVVGVVEQTAFQLQPSLWTSVPTWRAMRDAVRPELRAQTDVVNAIAVRVDANADAAAVAAAITTAVPGSAVLSADEAALAIPGVEQQNSTLQSIIVITYAVAALVVALFFALLVLEKRALFAVLKAIGTTNGSLAVGVVVQAAGATIVSIIIGALLARAFGLIIPETVPVLFRDQTLLITALATLAFGVLGSLFSLRRIARIDPATAIGGAA